MTCKEMILSNDYVDLITDYLLPPEYEFKLPISYCFHHVEGELGVLYADRRNIDSAGINFSYTFLPKCYSLAQQQQAGGQSVSNEIPFLESGITTMQNAPLNLTGKGVLIGIIDTGIRYQEEAFLDAFGRTRIAAIWDQTIQTGEPPEGFEYGSEYTQTQINEALRSDNPLEIVPSYDENGHGTAMASVAAGGSGRIASEQRALGAATDCQLVIVKLKEAKQYLKNYYYIPENVPCFQENDIILAIQYLQKFVKNLSVPMVICLGLETNLGDHTGDGLLNRYANYLSTQISRLFVAPAGNEGNHAHHFHGTLSDESLSEDVEIRVAAGCIGFVADFYGDLPYQFEVSVRTPAGEYVQIVQAGTSGIYRNRSMMYSFLFEGTKLYVEYSLVAPYSGAQFIRFRFEKPVEGIWTLSIRVLGNPRQAQFDIWLPVEAFLSSEVYFLRPEPDVTITEPGLMKSALCVSTYQSSTGGIWQQSGRGYTRDDRKVPDIAAPGVQIATILGLRTGSSMAAAITAGAMAQLFQWLVVERNEIFADASLLLNLCIRGASRDPNLNYPNRVWGYGKLDLIGIFRYLAGIF